MDVGTLSFTRNHYGQINDTAVNTLWSTRPRIIFSISVITEGTLAVKKLFTIGSFISRIRNGDGWTTQDRHRVHKKITLIPKFRLTYSKRNRRQLRGHFVFVKMFIGLGDWRLLRTILLYDTYCTDLFILNFFFSENW